MGERIHNTAIDSKQWIKLVSRMDTFGFCTNNELIRIALEIKFSFRGEYFKPIELFLGYDFRTALWELIPVYFMEYIFPKVCILITVTGSVGMRFFIIWFTSIITYIYLSLIDCRF